MSDWNAQVIAEFRANGGKVEQFGDAPLVILNTVGAKSGQIREIPLVMLLDGDRKFVFASAAGSPKHPDWYYNLIATPEIEVEIGTDKTTARLEPLPEPDRGDRLSQMGEVMPQFVEYVTNAAPRVIPAFEIVGA